LALDPGETTGFAVLNLTKGNLTVLGYGEIPVLGTGIDALVRCTWEWLERTAPSLEPGFQMAFEGPLMVYSARTKIELHEVWATIRLWALTHETVHESYHPSTVKATVTGKAGATKTQVANSVRKLFGLPKLSTDHASDAIAIGVTHAVKAHHLKLKGTHLVDLEPDLRSPRDQRSPSQPGYFRATRKRR